MADHTDNHASDEAELPPALRAALREEAGRLFVPSSVDDAVLDRARQHLRPLRRRRRHLYVGWAGSVAALLALAVWLTDPFTPTQPGPPLVRQDAPTILDAFALARRQAAGDLSIDQQQIDAAARLAVRLPGPQRKRASEVQGGGA